MIFFIACILNLEKWDGFVKTLTELSLILEKVLFHSLFSKNNK